MVCVDDALNSKIAYVPEDRLTEGLHLNQSIADNAIARILRNYTGHMGLLKMKELEKKTKRKSEFYECGRNGAGKSGEFIVGWKSTENRTD